MPSARERVVARPGARTPVEPGLGQRVRDLRLAQGLTQRQVAGSDFTKAFISLIETGRVRMSLRAAQIIAERLNTTVAELLGSASMRGEKLHEVTLARAEAALRAGKPGEALALVKELDEARGGLLRARARRVRGRALTETGKGRAAIAELDAALRAFDAVANRELAVRTRFDLAQAHSRLDERAEALSLAFDCERALHAREIVDRTFELQVATFIAQTQVTLGDYGSADLRTERIKALAEDVTDPRAVAALYESLAVTRQEQGDYDAALDYARRALASYEHLELEAMVGSCWNTIGWIFVQRKHYSKAQEALDTAERSASVRNDERLLGYVLQTRAELELGRGHAKEAVRLADASIAQRDAAPRGRALSLLLRAQALDAAKAPLAEVNEAFERAFDSLKPYGKRQLARAHQLHFEVLTRRGQLKAAADAARLAFELLRPALA